LVGRVTGPQCEEIKALFERKNALTELFKTLAESNPINDTAYEKVVADLGKVTTRFSQWWATTSQQYQWESAPNGRWEIDFEDGSIYLARPEAPARSQPQTSGLEHRASTCRPQDPGSGGDVSDREADH
jgi:CXXX repeat modification system protein